MGIDKLKVKKILVVSLSNIGDIVLTFPVLDILKNDFPKAKVSVVIGPKGEPLLKDNTNFERVYIYDKRQPLPKTAEWVNGLRREGFDLVVDLRNTAIPFFLWPRYRTSFFLRRDKQRHMREQHLSRLQQIYPFPEARRSRYALYVKPYDQAYIDEIIRREIKRPDRIVVVSPGAADQKKRWSEDGFAAVCDTLAEVHQASLVFIGDASDKEGVARIQSRMNYRALDLSGRANLTQAAYLISRARLLLSNDSAPMHLASYLNIPVVALFGPTSPERYGPWSANSAVVKRDTDIGSIAVPDVLEALKSKI